MFAIDSDTIKSTATPIAALIATAINISKGNMT